MVAGKPATTRTAARIDRTSNTTYRAGGRERRMAPRTSSLRQRHSRAALTAGVVLAALTSTGTALGAGGAPLPEPDAPLPTQSTRSVKAPAAKTSTTTDTTQAGTTETSATPTPDAPIGATTTEPAPARTAPVAVTPVAPAASQPAASRPAPSATTRANRTTTKPKPRPKPKAAAAPARPRTTPPVLQPPHDVRRLGLPHARLVPVTSDESTRTALLVAAAVLLVASGAGSLTVGLSVRRLARGA